MSSFIHCIKIKKKYTIRSTEKEKKIVAVMVVDFFGEWQGKCTRDVMIGRRKAVDLNVRSLISGVQHLVEKLPTIQKLKKNSQKQLGVAIIFTSQWAIRALRGCICVGSIEL